MSAAPGLFRPPQPQNEPVKSYAPGAPERAEVQLRLQEMRSQGQSLEDLFVNIVESEGAEEAVAAR